jgi:pyruvate dehydrogenase E2 component (dihydrolipoamide acetyltransferase)
VQQDFLLPDLGEGLTEAEIVRWCIAEGDSVNEDDTLLEVATDKTTVEIPSPFTGTVARIHVQAGELAPVGTVLVTIKQPNGSASPSHTAFTAAPASSTTAAEQHLAQPPPSTASTIRATPLVRRMAAQLGIDLAMVDGSGRNGLITEADLTRHSSADCASDPKASDRREPIRGVRRRIVEHLSTAHREVPAVTFVEECDFTGVDLRMLVPLALKAVAGALDKYPELNARLEGDEIVYLSRRDIGVAVQTTAGLVVPVIRGCDALSIEDLTAEVGRLATSANAGTLRPEELRNSTFTVTSAGRLGGVLATPIINYPEVGILGLHRITDRPAVRNGQIVSRRLGHVSITFDHRVVDGTSAAAFCLDVISRLEAARAGEGNALGAASQAGRAKAD